jgi:hypothetical protein
MSASPQELVKFAHALNRETIHEQQKHIQAMEIAMRGMLKWIDDYASDHDGDSYFTSTGCIECTLGTVPNTLNTGLCVIHQARRLLK